MKKKTREDYLRAIYLMNEDQEDKSVGVRSVKIAKSLGVSKPSVSDMMDKLSEEGLIKADPYSTIQLSKKGLAEAKNITKKHRIIEVFLVDVLGYSGDQVEEETHRLEHAFSDETVTRIAKLLKNPKVCPHGNKINI